mmetsp:Transcript_60805/g.130683  ORF Transcript_60805/g.130683 Transcript_60805/m.130683 type:complete len:210 (+) Transcript_60805:101-730(+)
MGGTCVGHIDECLDHPSTSLQGRSRSASMEQLQHVDATSVVRPCHGGSHCVCGQGDARLCPSAIIFLDVDGVLHSTSAPSDGLFGTRQLMELRRIVGSTGAKIVLSSAWRLSYVFADRVSRELWGAGLPGPISATPSLNPWHTEGRALEIRAWLSAHAGLVDADRWVAIDDIPLSMDLPHEHVVTTNGQVGLTRELADSAIAKLKGRHI